MSVRSRAKVAGSALLVGARAATQAARGGQPEPQPPEPTPEPPAPPRDDVFTEACVARTVPQAPDPAGPVTRDLHARLTDEDLAALHERMEPMLVDYWNTSPEELHPRLALLFSTFYGLPGALEHTGLIAAMPPEDVHAMSRGAFAAGGDPATADLLITSLEQAGVALPEGATVLDFGCSSGRVLRPIAAWRPDLDCVGCDPNEGAIAWATENLPGMRFFVSPLEPPLDADDGSVDVAYAISVWSHFDEELGLAWLREMHRLIKPGGALILTTHGYDALGGFVRAGEMTRDSAAEVARRFVEHGHHYFDMFGPDGDWGVKHKGWGNGFMTLDWLASKVTPQWSVGLYRPGQLQNIQDVVVLVRR